MTPAIIFIVGLILGSFLSVIFSRLEISEDSTLPKKGGSKRVKTASLQTSSSRRRGTGKKDSRLRGNDESARGRSKGSARGNDNNKRGNNERAKDGGNFTSGLKAILFGRSRCDHCHTQIRWYDNVPLISYLVLQARCRHCGQPISHFHPVLELCAALSLLAAYFQFGLSPLFYVVGAFSLVMLLIFSYDLKHSLIPNVFVVPAIVAALVLIGIQFVLFYANSIDALTLWSPDPVQHLIGGAVGGGFFLALSLLSRGTWVGGGDIKLGALIGLLLGWPYVIAAFILAYVIGTLYSVALLLSRQATLKSVIPFGPMLVTSFFLTAYYGDRLIKWYQGWFV